jgi:hypothetical protein
LTGCAELAAAVAVVVAMEESGLSDVICSVCGLLIADAEVVLPVVSAA